MTGAITYRQEMRRCGSATCDRCREGLGHGPYWYGYYRDESGRLRSRYFGKARPDTDSGEPERQRPRPSTLTPEQRPTPLRIHLLGGLVVERGGAPVSEREWSRGSARRLFALLALHPDGLSRDEVREALWPERDAETTAGVLKVGLSVLRRILEPGTGAATGPHEYTRLPLRQQRLCLRLHAEDYIDVRAFTSAADPRSIPLTNLMGLVALYQGHLLPEYRYEEWVVNRAEALRRRWHTLSLHLAQRLLEKGQTGAATERLQAILADDETQEEAARLLMSIYATQGRRALALQVYQSLAVALEHELDVEPDPGVRAVADQVRRESAPATPSLPVRLPREIAERARRRIARLIEQPMTAENGRRLARLWAERALALEALGLPQEAQSSLESGLLALGTLDYPAEHSRLLLAAATIQYRQGQGRAAHEAAMRAEQLAGIAGERGLEAWALRLRAQASEALGRVEESIALARASVALHDSMGAAEQALRGRRVLAFALWRAARFTEAFEQHRYNLEIARGLGRPEHLAYVLCGLGQALCTRGDLDAAEPHLVDALDVATRLEDRYLTLSIEYHLATLWAERAFLLQDADGAALTAAREEALTRFERVLELARAHRSGHMIVAAAVDLAVALAQWGRLDDARAFLALAERELETVGEHVSMRGWTALSGAELALASGDAEAAIARFTRALPLLEQSSPLGLAQAHRVAALAWHRRGEPEQAKAHWSASLDAARRQAQALEELRTRKALARSEPRRHSS